MSKPKEIKNCTNCGGLLEYSPQLKSLHCYNCEADFPCKFDNGITKHSFETKFDDTKYNQWILNNKVCNCDNCGAKLVFENGQFAKQCPYCLSSFVSKTETVPGHKPDALVPFKIEKSEAKKLYKDGVKKKWFLPNKFKKEVPVSEIKGIYIPSFGIDANSSSTYSGTLENHNTTRVNGKYVTIVNTKHISGTYNMVHKDFLVESSEYIEQSELAQIKPYHMGEVVKYSDDFVRGFNMEYYNQTPEACKVIAEREMQEDIRKAILNQYSYDSVRSFDMTNTFTNEMYAYTLLPVYKVQYNYKEKTYKNFMNGQTGKVGGKVPRSAVKITFFVLFLVAVAAGLGYLIYKYLA